jgi:hypothetical protein
MTVSPTGWVAPVPLSRSRPEPLARYQRSVRTSRFGTYAWVSHTDGNPVPARFRTVVDCALARLGKETHGTSVTRVAAARRGRARVRRRGRRRGPRGVQADHRVSVSAKKRVPRRRRALTRADRSRSSSRRRPGAVGWCRRGAVRPTWRARAPTRRSAGAALSRGRRRRLPTPRRECRSRRR